MEAEKVYQEKTARTLQQKQEGGGTLQFVNNRQNRQCIQLFTMDSNGLVGTVSIDNEENGPHNGHTISRHVISEQAARARLINNPRLNAVSFWRTHDFAHEAFKKVFTGRQNRGLKYWAGESNYNPSQTRVKVTGVRGDILFIEEILTEPIMLKMLKGLFINQTISLLHQIMLLNN